MMNALLKQIEKNYKERRRWLALVLCLSIMVSFETFAALRLKGETRTYTKQVLECPFAEEGAEPVAHTHNDDCYDEDGNLVCTLPEREEHTHTEDCYVETRVPVCKLEETPGHLHTDECYTEESKIGCGQEEDEGQQHTEECGHVERELTCDKDEFQVHIHNADCFRTVELNVEEFEEPQESLEEDPEVESELTGEPEPTEEPESAEEREPAEEFEQMEEPEPTEEQDPTRETEPTEDQEPSEEEALPEEQEPEEESEPEEEPEEKGEPKPTEEQELTKELEPTEEQEPVEGQEAFEEPEESQETELTEEQEPEEEPEPSEEQDLNEEQELNEGQEVLGEPEQSEETESTEEQKEDTVLPEEIKDDETTEEEEDSETVEDESAVPMPAQCFEKSAGGVKVTVEAPNGALPENTRMSVEPLNGNLFRSTVADVIEGDVLEVQAVDISFYTAEGTEIEPAIPIRVIITPASSQHENKDTQVVHVDDSGVASMVVQTEDENAGKRDVVFDTESFSIYCVVFSTEVYYKSFTGDTFKITLDYDKDSGIPNGAELRVSEILPEVEEYEDYYAQAVQAVAGGVTLLENAYARFFDIEIWSEGEKIEPTGTVTVSIKLEDTPTETDALPTVVHFAESGTQIIESEICTDENETEFIRFTTESFSIFGMIAAMNADTQVQIGSLKLKTVVKVNNEDPDDVNRAITDGVYQFTITGPEASTDTHTVIIEYGNGVITETKIDGVSVDVDTDGFVEVPDLLPGEYVITETEPDNGTSLSSVTGGNGNGDLTHRDITVTVTSGEAGDQVADAGTAIFVNNINTLSIKKEWVTSTGANLAPPVDEVEVKLVRSKDELNILTVILVDRNGEPVGCISEAVEHGEHVNIEIKWSDQDKIWYSEGINKNNVLLNGNNAFNTYRDYYDMTAAGKICTFKVYRVLEDLTFVLYGGDDISNLRFTRGTKGDDCGTYVISKNCRWEYAWTHSDSPNAIPVVEGDPVLKETDNLTAYNYYAIEVTKVNGFVASYIRDDGTIYIQNKSDSNNVYTYGIRLQIVDSTIPNKPLGGSKFALYRSETENGTYSIVTSIENLALDSNNWFAVPEEGVEIGGLTTGYYKITEETPPAGYIITDRTPVLFRISEDGAIENNSAADVIYSESEREFRVPNTPGVELPMTGEIGTSMYTVLGGILTATAGALLALRARKRES